MLHDSMYIWLGYLSGSVLYARIFSRLFQKENMLEQSKDHNPGTANAFMYGGFWCGLLTLLFDLGKGFFPVYLFILYRAASHPAPFLSALVIAAPVIGHIFPLFYRFRGGKGIAVTFGCLLGLYPVLHPLFILAFCFIFFSSILKVSPHFYRTIFSYACSLVIMIREIDTDAVVLGFFLISAAVLIKMLTSKEERDKLEVKLLGRTNPFLRDRRRT